MNLLHNFQLQLWNIYTVGVARSLCRRFLQAALRPVRARVLCQMRAPYSYDQLTIPTNCEPPKLRARVLQHPLNAALVSYKT